MEFTKYIYIKNKVINSDDIIKLASIIENDSKDNRYMLTYVISFLDDSTISSDNLDIFSSDEFNRQTIKKISMDYRSNSFQTISIDIIFDEFYYKEGNRIYIKSNDEKWINDIISKYNYVIKTIEPQKKLAIFNEMFFFPFYLLISMFFVIILSIFSAKSISNLLKVINKKSIMNMSLIFAVIFIILFALIIISICKGYPIIEFKYKREFQNTHLIKRQWIGYLITTIIIPIILMTLDWFFNYIIKI